MYSECLNLFDYNQVTNTVTGKKKNVVSEFLS